MQPFGRNRYGPKIGGGELGLHLTQCGEAEAYLRAKFHLDPSNRLATIHQRYSCLHGQAPQYLFDVCQPVFDVASRRHLRSAGRRLLNVPHQRRSTFARRAFSVAGPSVWNSLPDYLRDPCSQQRHFLQAPKDVFVFSVLIYVSALELLRRCAI